MLCWKGGVRNETANTFDGLLFSKLAWLTNNEGHAIVKESVRNARELMHLPNDKGEDVEFNGDQTTDLLAE